MPRPKATPCCNPGGPASGPGRRTGPGKTGGGPRVEPSDTSWISGSHWQKVGTPFRQVQPGLDGGLGGGEGVWTGRAQLATLEPHEYHEALMNLNRAFDYYAEVGDVNQAVAAAQSPVQASPLSGHRTGIIDLINRALALVSPDSHEARCLLCQYGNTLYYEAGDYRGAQ
jgi:hypothetical protein